MDMNSLQRALPSSTSNLGRVYTFKNPYPQRFSILYHIIDYMIKNLKSGKTWKKLLMTCKFFFFKKPIVPVGCLEIKCDMKCKAYGQNFDVTLPFPKLWIFDSLETKRES
uniref:Uncharacterized protein n=1 Tax=Panagrolaimus sp. ES5 TaxID=591445 RepID=A0AC34G8Q6_9BILA